ncbi:hypothetical protein C8F04DRAFT_403307 [Mycena alexandri]|uniref:Uncharacterized protein n=1 Tax=Mycena alexandri TaxID=1745969 RepID=A0AAD6T0P5_9AGAR|nr:hypothetical protein C8F04DRAFT_403307 [Mycena alexandri]
MKPTRVRRRRWVDHLFVEWCVSFPLSFEFLLLRWTSCALRDDTIFDALSARRSSLGWIYIGACSTPHCRVRTTPFITATQPADYPSRRPSHITSLPAASHLRRYSDFPRTTQRGSALTHALRGRRVAGCILLVIARVGAQKECAVSQAGRRELAFIAGFIAAVNVHTCSRGLSLAPGGPSPISLDFSVQALICPGFSLFKNWATARSLRFAFSFFFKFFTGTLRAFHTHRTLVLLGRRVSHAGT